jgi:YHS domain-containing protein
MPMKHDIGDTTFYNGKYIAFCSDGCKTEFIKNPKAYDIK